MTRGGSLVQAEGSTIPSPTGTFSTTVTSSEAALATASTNLYVYNYWSSPITQAAASLLNGASHRRRYVYHEPSNTWVNSDAGLTTQVNVAGDAKFYAVFANGANRLIPGVGYTSLRSSTAPSVTFTGIPNNGTIDVNASRTGGTSGYNLVGNPYPSVLLIADADGATTGLLEDSDNNAFEASAWIFDNGTSNNGSGAYITINAASPVNVITTGQGFMVRRSNNSNGALRFKNLHRVSGNNSAFYRGEATGIEHLSLKVRRPADNFADNFVLALADNFADAYENGRDARKLDANTALNLAARWEGERLAQVALGKKDRLEIPLVLNTNRTGELVFATEQLPSSTTLPLFLEDRATGEFHYLQPGREHKLTVGAGVHEGRFFIRTINEAASASGKQVESTQAFSYGYQLYVRFTQADQGQANVFVHDVMGNKVRSFNGVQANRLQAFDLNGLEDGIYIVRTVSATGSHEQRVWIGPRK